MIVEEDEEFLDIELRGIDERNNPRIFENDNRI